MFLLIGRKLEKNIYIQSCRYYVSQHIFVQ